MELLMKLVLLISAAAAAPSLSCSVTRQPDGSILYELSAPPTSPRCETCWEDLNKTVIARYPDFDPNKVQKVTNRSVTLTLCRDFLHYTTSCASGWEEAHCRINCSFLEEVKVHTNTVNTTLICISESWCLTQVKFGVIVAGILLLGAAVLGGLYCWRSRKCRRGGSAATRASYSPANEQIKMEMGEIEEGSMKT